MTQTSTESSRQGDWKMKERVTADQLKKLLRDWLSAIDENKDFEFQLREGTCTVPSAAIEKGKVKVEYEVDEGEYEFEIELKWRPSGDSSPTVQ